jgi:hypothetical protein
MNTNQHTAITTSAAAAEDSNSIAAGKNSIVANHQRRGSRAQAGGPGKAELVQPTTSSSGSGASSGATLSKIDFKKTTTATATATSDQASTSSSNKVRYDNSTANANGTNGTNSYLHNSSLLNENVNLGGGRKGVVRGLTFRRPSGTFYFFFAFSLLLLLYYNQYCTESISLLMHYQCTNNLRYLEHSVNRNLYEINTGRELRIQPIERRRSRSSAMHS